jgi:phage portal protein BeeE
MMPQSASLVRRGSRAQPGSVVLRDWLRSARRAASRALSVRNDARYKLSDREAMAELFQANARRAAGDATTAMQVTAVYACIALLAGAQAILPLCFFERVDNLAGRKRIKHDLWWLFNEQPSPLIPAAVFWEYIGATRKLQGDGFALMVRNRAGTITEMLPLSPLEVRHPARRQSLRVRRVGRGSQRRRAVRRASRRYAAYLRLRLQSAHRPQPLGDRLGGAPGDRHRARGR